jgi:hypothetical protein
MASDTASKKYVFLPFSSADDLTITQTDDTNHPKKHSHEVVKLGRKPPCPGHYCREGGSIAFHLKTLSSCQWVGSTGLEGI